MGEARSQKSSESQPPLIRSLPAIRKNCAGGDERSTSSVVAVDKDGPKATLFAWFSMIADNRSFGVSL